jgi:cell division protein ZapB
VPIVSLQLLIAKSTNLVPMTIHNFEQKLDQLIATCQQLKEENTVLREREADLAGERIELLQKNEMARNQIKTMITRLQSLSSE